MGTQKYLSTPSPGLSWKGKWTIGEALVSFPFSSSYCCLCDGTQHRTGSVAKYRLCSVPMTLSVHLGFLVFGLAPHCLTSGSQMLWYILYRLWRTTGERTQRAPSLEHEQKLPLSSSLSHCRYEQLCFRELEERTPTTPLKVSWKPSSSSLHRHTHRIETLVLHFTWKGLGRLGVGPTETQAGVSLHSECCWLSKLVDSRTAGLPASTLCILEWFFSICFVFVFDFCFFLPVASVPLSSKKSRLSPINVM